MIPFYANCCLFCIRFGAKKRRNSVRFLFTIGAKISYPNNFRFPAKPISALCSQFITTLAGIRLDILLHIRWYTADIWYNRVVGRLRNDSLVYGLMTKACRELGVMYQPMSKENRNRFGWPYAQLIHFKHSVYVEFRERKSVNLEHHKPRRLLSEIKFKTFHTVAKKVTICLVLLDRTSCTFFVWNIGMDQEPVALYSAEDVVTAMFRMSGLELPEYIWGVYLQGK